MTNLGIGAMLHVLSGGSSEDPVKYVGRKIVAASIDDENLRLTFEDGVKIRIFDNGQSCCEHRYLTCDDDVQTLVGGALRAIESKPGPEEEGEHGDVHEQVFLEVSTDKGFITVANHNEHNGYYGGFVLSIREEA